MFQNTLLCPFYRGFTQEYGVQIKDRTTGKYHVLYWTNRAHVAPLYTNYKQYISNNRIFSLLVITTVRQKTLLLAVIWLKTIWRFKYCNEVI